MEGSRYQRERPDACPARALTGRRQAVRRWAVDPVTTGPYKGLRSTASGRGRTPSARWSSWGSRSSARQEVLGTRREREREAEAVGRLACRGDPLGGVVELVDGALAVPVLDRAADRARLGGPDDGACDLLRRMPMAILEV